MPDTHRRAWAHLDTDAAILRARHPDQSTSRVMAETMAKRAGRKLDERRMAILLENAPAALEMANRIRKPRDRLAEPSSTYRFAK